MPNQIIDIPMREPAILAEVIAMLHMQGIDFKMTVESGNYIIKLR
jgi:hypothetical protein